MAQVVDSKLTESVQLFEQGFDGNDAFSVDVRRDDSGELVSATLRNCSILTSESLNDRRYSPAVIEAAGIYDGVAVFISHGNSEDYTKLIGRTSQPRTVSGRIRGDVELNPRHELAESIVWTAENHPEMFALSHEILPGQYEADFDAGGKKVITKIKSVQGLALVRTGGVNRSIHESKGTPTMSEKTYSQTEMDTAVREAIAECLCKNASNDGANVQESEELKTLRAENAFLQSQLDTSTTQSEAVQEELDTYKAKEVLEERKLDIKKEAEELSAGDISEALLEKLSALDAETCTSMLEDRASLIKESASSEEDGEAEQSGEKLEERLNAPQSETGVSGGGKRKPVGLRAILSGHKEAI